MLRNLMHDVFAALAEFEWALIRERTAAGLAAARPHVMKVKRWLRVVNNSRYVRGKGKARDEIERHVLSRFGLEKPDKAGWDYVLSIRRTVRWPGCWR